MLVYRSATRRVSPDALVDEITGLITGLIATADASEDTWTELLIACGELESAATDAIAPECDELTPLASALNQLTNAAAAGALASWGGDHGAARDVSITQALDGVRGALATVSLSRELEIGVPEGFAYYGLYPETYAAAARELLDARCPAEASRIVCIGIRSIGTTLGAVVAAVARERGREVVSLTVRPRGHPFDRRLTLGPALRDALAREAAASALFAIVDEGPGLSGSSFASVADAIGGLGVPDERIVLLPSWIPASDDLRSARGRDRWSRHQKFCTSFEQLFESTEEPVNIARRMGISAARTQNVSGGAWRRVVYDDERDWPGVQPQHERRKYLVRDASGASVALLKFAGLGRSGRAAVGRARTLAAAGVAPRVLGAQRGLVATEWVAGDPAFEGEADATLIDAVAQHVAHLARATRSHEAVPFDELLHIAHVNTSEALGDEVGNRLGRALERSRPRVMHARVCAVDGRMLPHEWICSAHGWRKVDGIDHHDDHFLPGDQEPAWDIASAIVELLLDAQQTCALIDAYIAASGDRDVVMRLPFHHAVYLATRLGYVTLAAESLGDQPDATRLRALARRYTAMLRRAAVTLGAIEPLSLPAAWDNVRAIVFDADGTLRRTTVAGAPCPHAPDEWQLLPWAADGVLTRLPWGNALALGVASNQDHVGYGHLSERQARALLRSMAVEATGAVADSAAVQLCPHVLEIACACRKPGGGMLHALLTHWAIAPDALLFVGDTPTDAEAARRAGARFVHVDDFAHALAAAARGAAPHHSIISSSA